MTRVNLLLLCVLVGCALSLVTSRHQARRLYVELERERAEARRFDVEYGQLSLEQSTWAMPARVEKIARESLHMQLPAPSRVQVVESPDAAISVVAGENAMAQATSAGAAK
jgi:cell division protein FtsL